MKKKYIKTGRTKRLMHLIGFKHNTNAKGEVVRVPVYSVRTPEQCMEEAIKANKALPKGVDEIHDDSNESPMDSQLALARAQSPLPPGFRIASKANATDDHE